MRSSVFDQAFTEIRFPVVSGNEEAHFVRGILEGKGVRTLAGDTPSTWLGLKRSTYALVKVEMASSPLAAKIISEYLRTREKPRMPFVKRAAAFLKPF